MGLERALGILFAPPRRYGRHLATGCALAALGATTVAGCGSSSPNPVDQASRLRQLNPGARIGGDTIVATADNQRVLGSQSRPNFMMGLGKNETIVGGPGDDELGAFGTNDTIVAGPGTDQLYGGPGSTLDGGTGRNLLTEYGDNGTIRVTSSGDEVVMSGEHDRVLCSPTSRNDTIYKNQSDYVDPTCTRNNAVVLPLSHPQLTAARTPAARVSGAGTFNDPYVTACNSDPPPPSLGLSPDDCEVSGFQSRDLFGTWKSESIPAYQCPADHPYLLSRAFRDSKELPLGVGYLTYMADVYINSINGAKSQFGSDYFVGTSAFQSSATNWNPNIFDKDARGNYKIILYCTSNTARASTRSRGGFPLL